MFFFFTCGTHTFTSKLAGAEHITVQCQNCGNFSGRYVFPSSSPYPHTPFPVFLSLKAQANDNISVMKRWEWFTFCFIPVIPFSLKPYKEVGCHICNFWQDIKYRPDVQQQIGGTVAGAQQPAVMMGGAGGGGHGHGGPPPSGVPQYK
jgi:hypothetical protein